ncbi:hypothetical protein SAMN05421678_103347 [Actinopolymorpha cephalotaxi]|uniref:DUF4232 domain-containing protein n=1 Tax=Actinopolymorpha cephalotaxi TaxID=504797 RepID=A0A1I2NHH6_9ACTN|nr:hypothetical protein [Actinopolymorpha cephalotaxi]NYH85545.1 hypothetical protein [Actinopolymorpha cephalotaxi]SFG02490.1 hypothetical protein SAMN05421678_103347 [Actinopolymorpha cephalotaxi]
MIRPLLRPVGPLPASAYWLRRGVLLAVVVLLVWALVAFITPDGPGRGNAQGAPTDSPTPTQGPTIGPNSADDSGAVRRSPAATVRPSGTSSPSPTTSPKPSKTPAREASPKTTPRKSAGLAACDPGWLGVKAEVTRSPVEAGKPVVVTVRLLNSGSDPCRLTIDSKSLRVLVTSGSDHIWDTADCRGLPEVPVVLKAKEQRNLAVRWPGVRSRAGCPSGQPAAKPGYYTADVTVGGVGPVTARFRLS